MKIKITTVGNSAGIVLPKELLARLRLQKGDALYATELPDGIKLSPFDPDLASQMEVAEKVMREDRNVLRKLAEDAKLDPDFAEKFLNFIVKEVIRHHEAIAKSRT